MKVIIPGTFSILHKGHTNIYLELLSLGYNAYFGVTAAPYDKHNLPSVEDRTRVLDEFQLPYIELSGKSLLQHWIEAQEKLCSRKIGIAIGHDTFERFLNPEYYLNSPKLLAHIIDSMQYAEFIIFPRNGKLKVDSNIILKNVRYMCDFEEVDLSSTKLRELEG
jgi:nicotinic acid mononucleotide adenylyltransferase